tara:strand:- start:6054 stop:6473 length:420 start_codon:yes stop_codon:yes gene_type:complete
MDYVWNDGLFEIFEKSVLSQELMDYRAELYQHSPSFVASWGNKPLLEVFALIGGIPVGLITISQTSPNTMKSPTLVFIGTANESIQSALLSAVESTLGAMGFESLITQSSLFTQKHGWYSLSGFVVSNGCVSKPLMCAN